MLCVLLRKTVLATETFEHVKDFLLNRVIHGHSENLEILSFLGDYKGTSLRPALEDPKIFAQKIAELFPAYTGQEGMLKLADYLETKKDLPQAFPA